NDCRYVISPIWNPSTYSGALSSDERLVDLYATTVYEPRLHYDQRQLWRLGCPTCYHRARKRNDWQCEASKSINSYSISLLLSKFNVKVCSFKWKFIRYSRI